MPRKLPGRGLDLPGTSRASTARGTSSMARRIIAMSNTIAAPRQFDRPSARMSRCSSIANARKAALHARDMTLARPLRLSYGSHSIVTLETGCQHLAYSADCPRHKDSPERYPACDPTRANADRDCRHSGSLHGRTAGARRFRERVHRQPRRHFGFRVPRAVTDARQTRRPGLARRRIPQGVLRRRVRRDLRIRTRARARRSKWISGPAATGACRKIFRATCGCRSTPIPTIRAASATTAPSSPRTVGYRNQLYLAAIYSPNTKAIGSSAGYEEGNAWAVEIVRTPSAQRAFLDFCGPSATTASTRSTTTATTTGTSTLTATLKPFELQLAYLGVERTRRGPLRRRFGG